ncbi:MULTISPECIES: primosomal protein [unclassified Microbacterium]|uniref:primosomal protein n=1 Tax=unclassified Microbacterium TaxID=2609290 RepID=UPI00214C7E63|nr:MULTISPECIES: primosomal protein [unclassified Microbacterium]MCR2809029.1 primosomal protein [Microbacterium sp. zg.B185]WIM20186.1 primosomal protein [Microbacterium sp. zg-B185]
MADDDPTRRSREGEPPQRRRSTPDGSRHESSGRAERAPRAGDKKPYVKRDADRPAYPKRDGEKKPYAAREGERKSYPPRDGERKPYVKRDGDRPAYPKRDGEKKPYAAREGERKSYPPREGERKPYVKRDGDRPAYPKRDGERKPYVKRDGERPSYPPRDGERKSYPPRDGERKPYVKRDGERPSYPPRDGERKPYVKRDGERPSYPPRDGERKSYPPRDGERKPYVKRDGERPSYPPRDSERKSYPPRDGERRSFTPRDGSSRPPRAGTGRDERRDDRQSRPEELRAVRSSFEEPVVPDEVVATDLNAAARNQLKTLSKENADAVARHLAMAAEVIDADPQLAHQHAIAATRRAGRIGVVRETAAITAYAIGDYALALRELRTYRRISGSDDQIALMVDSERGVGRPDRALEVGRAVDRASLAQSVRVELAIAMSGARLDLGETERALQELDIPELDPDRAFEWSPALFSARATVLEELGRDDEAREWHRRADVAQAALDAADGSDDLEVLYVEEVLEDPRFVEDEGTTQDELVEDEPVEGDLSVEDLAEDELPAEEPSAEDEPVDEELPVPDARNAASPDEEAADSESQD